MTEANKENEEAIVRSAGAGITKRSALVSRGLSSLTDTVWTSKKLFESAIWSGVISPFGHFAEGPHEILISKPGVQVQAQVVCVVEFDDPSIISTIEAIGEHFETKDVATDYYTKWRISGVFDDGCLEERRKIEK